MHPSAKSVALLKTPGPIRAGYVRAGPVARILLWRRATGAAFETAASWEIPGSMLRSCFLASALVFPQALAPRGTSAL